MSTESGLLESIRAALAAVASRPLRDSATDLLATLGYSSDRTLDLGSSKPRAFLELLLSRASNTGFDESKALFSDWASADLLFQITDEELSGQASLFRNSSVEIGLFRSYLFFAIELTGADYPRGKLTGIARQINRVFPMPVMVLIKHLKDKEPVLSIAVINRRRSKRDTDRDVLGKVTIIRDVSLTQPHRGHLDIMASFAVPNLVHPQRLPINNFDTLHATWEEIFNVELLNQRFYRELASWYSWALSKVEFPDDAEKDGDKRRATSLIRLLTRLVFCWFLKEKGLVSEKLFVEAEMKRILTNLEPEASTYYQAILQNLFFATLNQRMGKDRAGQPFRAFARNDVISNNRTTSGQDTHYRYKEHFRDPDSVLDHFADVPFLNGGLFECIDRLDEGTGEKIYLDGFSHNERKRPTVPNSLFFSEEQIVDRSEAEGAPKRKGERVRGLLRILHSYKFTIVENTPIDQEIALDPELLGKVFENLLASYTEETKTSARKQTGSFYTPRPIVDYMVDESLKAHFATTLTKAGMSNKEAQAGLEILFAYTERDHPFLESQVATLFDAIHNCKILDPACGSGAFPMGILHKLVFITQKLDPAGNRRNAATLAHTRFDNSTADQAEPLVDSDRNYFRKLYIIENCLFGIDIQPIAIQITKLRFFISLICEQQTNKNKRENHGIRPLPNLETKFVAANSLVSLSEVGQEGLVDSRVYKIESEIESLYHSHFSAEKRDQKRAIQKKVRSLRSEMARLLSQSLMSRKKSEHIAAWDPFDPQSSADFFDPHWMFGRALSEGFDVVIGNPPYSLISKEEFLKKFSSEYPLLSGKPDLYRMFVERSPLLLRATGVVCFIIPNTILAIPSAQRLRESLTKNVSIQLIANLTSPVFNAAAVNNIILQFAKIPPGSQATRIVIASGDNPLDALNASSSIDQSTWLRNPKSEWTILVSGIAKAVIEKLERRSTRLGQIDVDVCLGMQVYHNTIHTDSQIKRRYLHASRKNGDAWIAEYSGRHVASYRVRTNQSVPFVDYAADAIYQKPGDAFVRGPRLILREIVGARLVVGFAKEHFTVNKSCYIIRSDALGENDLKALLALLSSKCVSFWVRLKGDKAKQALFPRITMSTLKAIPLPKDWREHVATLCGIVDGLLAAEAAGQNGRFAELEVDLDKAVSKIYGITPEEMATLESHE